MNSLRKKEKSNTCSKYRKYVLVVWLFSFVFINAQHKSYWQQQANYTMSINMNVDNYQYDGIQKIVYTNNSPEALTTVFYHLYFNAFQPGSEMDIRLQNIADPDSRMVNNIGTKILPVLESRISKLKPNEIGYININSLKQDGKKVTYKTIGTILKVTLYKPIKPGEKTDLEMTFNGQVPLQIRRSGRNSKEGVALSMTQWYPKLAEYDFEGWHANAYIGREFHGVWGDYDVSITIDKNYILGGTGYLQNPNEIGYGYETSEVKLPKGKKLTWHFIAPKVHDFAWAADPDYRHDKIQGENGVTLNFLYKKTLKKEYLENWKKLQPKTAELLSYYNKHIGTYPYKQYSVIQGGDGGMEYGMCTLIEGERKLNSLIGVTAHEFAHTWFQFLLATNETKHEWMDEGFTTYISDLAMNEIMQQHKENPHKNSYKGYTDMVLLGIEEPQSLFADRFKLNSVYGTSAYSKGEIFLAQLGYIIGEENLQKTLKKYFQDFKFKHPTPNDFIRTAEKISGLQLGWYLNEWTQTTHSINYAITSVNDKEITLENKGSMPMPIEIRINYSDGSKENFYIPLRMLLGKKPTKATILKDWSWVMPVYTFSVSKTIKSVEIDPSHRMADIDRGDNVFEKP